MTERSRFWNGPADGSGTGDASEAEYDAHNEFAQVMTTVSGAGARANKGGVSFGERSNYAATVVGGAVRVQPGTGMVDGTWHDSDANVDVSIPTPASATRVDYIVLRKSETAQTVRITRIAGTEGAGVPALTQGATTWDVPLWQASITTAGTITLTDARQGLSGDVGGSLPSAINIGDAGSGGSSGIPAASDHDHPFPDPSGGPPAFDFGTAAAEGVATTPARSDHTHETPKVFRRRKSADQSVSGSTLADDSHLTVPVVNGEVYIFMAVLFVENSGAGDIQVGFNAPGGSSIRFGGHGPDTTTPGTIATIHHATVNTGFAIGADGTTRAVQLQGTLVAGADGTFVLRFAESTPAASATIKQNSNMIVFEV